MLLPDYQGGSIVNLMASIETGFGGEDLSYPSLRLLSPAVVAGKRRVLLLVIDGLGFDYLCAHPEAKRLNRYLVGSMTSVFPSTTTTAITTFLTGEAPQQHGLTGWHMFLRELGSVVAILPGRPRYGGSGIDEAGIDVARMLRSRPFAARLGVATHSLQPDFIAGSAFTRAYLGGAQLHPYQGLDGLVGQGSRLLAAPGDYYVHAYWPQLDSLGHRFGMHSDEARAHLLEIDAAVERLFDAAADNNALLLVTADHGQVDVPLQHQLEIADHPVLEQCLALPLCGEPRAAFCYLRPGSEDVFDDYVHGEFEGRVRSTRPQDSLQSGWFGLGDQHPELARRIGDRVLVAEGDHGLRDWLPHERRFEMIGMHGGLSRSEMLVPLLVAGT
jgi:hypothetical protein